MKKQLTIIFCIWFFALMAIGIYSSTSLSVHNGGTGCNIKNQLPYYRWDSFWYTSIARHGYTFSLEKNSSIAFFPLYPSVIRAINYLTKVKDDQISLILNIVFSLATVLILYLLVRIDYSDSISRNAVLLWLFFPPAYFLLSGYPEALFVLLVVVSFYFARKNNWLLAGIAAGLLALTKPYGVFMLPALLIEYFDVHNRDYKIFFKRFDWLPLLIPIFSFGGFVIFNYLKFGDPLAFLHAQNTWGRTLGNPITALLSETKFYLIDHPVLAGSNFPYLVYLVSFFVSIAAFVVSWKKVRMAYLIFPGLLLLSAFMTGTLTSWGRYMFLGVTIFVGPAIHLTSRKKLLAICLILSGLVLVFSASYFSRCFPFE